MKDEPESLRFILHPSSLILHLGMGTPHEPLPVKPIAGLLAASHELLAEARAALAECFGPIDAASAIESWEFDGYRGEMGAAIWRQYVAFAATMAPEELVARKLQANELEERWRRAGGRLVNVDPGYVDLNKLVLASTKDAGHRVYLGRGIYAEATLRFEHGSFVAFPFTYPDYAGNAARAFFTQVREAFRAATAPRPAPRGD